MKRVSDNVAPDSRDIPTLEANHSTAIGPIVRGGPALIYFPSFLSHHYLHAPPGHCTILSVYRCIRTRISSCAVSYPCVRTGPSSSVYSQGRVNILDRAMVGAVGRLDVAT